MPVVDPITDAFTPDIGKSELRDLMKARFPLTLADATVAAGMTLAGFNCLTIGGILFQLDPADTTSAHDGVTVIVSGDGYRFKPGQPAVIPSRVLDRTNTPPGAPAIGDAYIVGAAPSGAWAAHADDLALYTSRGWVFVGTSYLAGRLVYNAATNSSWQLADSGWRNGVGNLLVTEIVSPVNFASAVARVFSVVNQTTNTPPGSPADQVAYVVGPSPTGAWAGKQTQVAVYENAAWVFHVPREGDHVWDKALDRGYVWSGGVWYSPLADSQNFPRIAHAYATLAVAKSVIGGSNAGIAPFLYTYLSGTAPTTATRRIAWTDLAVSLAATAASKKLCFEFDGIDLSIFNTATPYTCTIAIYRDSDANAIAWGSSALIRNRLFALSTDAASHTYTLAITTEAALSTAISLPKDASFSVKEVAA